MQIEITKSFTWHGPHRMHRTSPGVYQVGEDLPEVAVISAEAQGALKRPTTKRKILQLK